ncbi:hypothetical protein COU58_02860 [Candidatus Pacearchaeota archaeon CG10_big_fil_rev_8_21_14_0_10_32_42]|nr:MAG: hypothetical protein COU58_02860 [Candidatus Pacearchaeota archaeon CG10_big_fil_rev_8_21_14_0_10_32_42]
MNEEELIKKITEKKEFSNLPKEDVEIAFSKFDKEENSDYQKLKLTRDFLRKVYSSFSSRKLLNIKDKDPEWVLMKHKSTKERFHFYSEVYSRIIKEYEKSKSLSIIDLGCGVNGFSLDFLKKINPSAKYVGVEAIGQLCKLANFYFKSKKEESKVTHLSLFNLDEVANLIESEKHPKIVLLFKVVDSLEVMKRNYSKDLLQRIVPTAEKVVVSFATKSLGSRKKFFVQREWLIKFIQNNFDVKDDFEIEGERYLIFSKKDL